MRDSYERVGEAIVIEDKKEGSSLVKCIQLGNSTNMSREFQLENVIELDDGTKVDASDYIEALWLMTSTNRRTAPDVTVGSKVVLYKHPSGEEYYWQEETPQLTKRKLEEITWMISNRPKGEDSEKEVPLEVGNYYVTFSSLNKTIRLETSTTDGEPVSYIWNFDLADGVHVVEDSNNNILYLDSVNGKYFNIVNDTIAHKAKNQVTLLTGDRNVYIQGSNVVTIDGLTMINTNAFAWKSKDAGLEIEKLLAYVKTLDMNITDEAAMTLGKLLLYVSKGPFEIFSPEFNVMSANTTFTGAVNVAGGIVVNSFAVGGAAPKAVAPKESKAKALDVKPWEDGKDAAIKEFEKFKTGEDVEKKEGEKSKDPVAPQEEQPAPEEPTSFEAVVDKPITLESKQGGVNIKGTANVEIKGAKVKIDGNGTTLASVISELIEKLTVACTGAQDSMGGPIATLKTLAGELGGILGKLKSGHE